MSTIRSIPPSDSMEFELTIPQDMLSSHLLLNEKNKAFPLRRICVFLTLFVVAVVVIYPLIAYYFYNRVVIKATACVECEPPLIIDDFELKYRDRGSSTTLPTIIVVHGGPAHSHLSFKDGLDFLEDHTRVIMYDQRGSGLSEVKSDTNKYTMELLVEELEAVRIASGSEKIVVIGHSFGGILAQRYALKYPDNVVKVILVGSVVINSNMGSSFILKYIGPTLYSFFLGFPPKKSADADEWFTFQDESSRLYNKSNAHLIEDSGPSRFVPWREFSISVAGQNYESELKASTIPFLIIYGSADTRFTGSEAAFSMCSLIPDCNLVEMKQSGHWPFLEEPGQFQSVVLDFLIK
ncbi:hypothetical protein GEMRC1_000585 [Eukaryota sp. GEM-RC1]